jgi:NAD(P)-dependent dehydrogenase (short-subunit alcohol dehydrogenase family)
MKIILIGGNGTLGQAIAQTLSTKHDILIAGRSSGDLICDIESPDSIKKMFLKIGTVDAVVIAAGSGRFKPLDTLTTADIDFGIRSKLMGQINTVLIGKDFVKESFTLTSGIIAEKPIVQGAAIAVANCGLEGFVRTAALELPQRINCISPTLVNESAEALGHLFPGIHTISAVEVAKVYQKSVEGTDTGTILHAW